MHALWCIAHYSVEAMVLQFLFGYITCTYASTGLKFVFLKLILYFMCQWILYIYKFVELSKPFILDFCMAFVVTVVLLMHFEVHRK